MQAVKRCGLCNTLNDADQLYCTRCGKYLSDKKINAARKLTVWDIPPEKEAVRQEEKKDERQKDSFVRCPVCHTLSQVVDGALPLACGTCGYFFQVGIDEILSGREGEAGFPERTVSGRGDDEQPDQIIGIQKGDEGRSGHTKKGNPLARAKRDVSHMRLIPASREKNGPESVSEDGEIIGADGTILKQIETFCQIRIWHSPAGWYARTLQGQPFYNGVPKNAGVPIKLCDGDVLTLEKEQIYVEIVAER